jgi:hypothetical protein
MIDLKRIGGVAILLFAAAMLAGCATTGDDGGIAANQQPEQLTPVQDSAVASASLPAIAGDGSVQVADTPPDQASALPPTASDAGDPGLAPAGTAGAPPAGDTQGSFVSLNDVGKIPSAPGRDLSGGLTIEKLLGGWTVASGDIQCRLNLTYTAKTGTDRYRASTPGCQIATLASVSSWQLSGGTQVQLFDDRNTLVGTLLLSGNRFIGTLAGGQAISMVG